MPFGNGKKYLRGSFQFSIVTIQKISPIWKPEIQLFRHFSKIKIEYFSGKKNLVISLHLNFTSNIWGCYHVTCCYALVWRRNLSDGRFSESLLTDLQEEEKRPRGAAGKLITQPAARRGGGDGRSGQSET